MSLSILCLSNQFHFLLGLGRHWTHFEWFWMDCWRMPKLEIERKSGLKASRSNPGSCRNDFQLEVPWTGFHFFTFSECKPWHIAKKNAQFFAYCQPIVIKNIRTYEQIRTYLFFFCLNILYNNHLYFYTCAILWYPNIIKNIHIYTIIVLYSYNLRLWYNFH